MTGFELQLSSIGIDHSTNGATAHELCKNSKTT